MISMADAGRDGYHDDMSRHFEQGVVLKITEAFTYIVTGTALVQMIIYPSE